MSIWKKFLLITVLGLVILIAILVSKLLIAGVGGGIYFFSFKPGFSWSVDKNKLSSYEEGLKGILGATPKALVVVSPNFNVTKNATGWGDNNPVIYGEWKKMYGWDVFEIYLDTTEWQKLSTDVRNRLLSLFIIREINSHFKVEKSNLVVEPLFLKL